MEKMIGRYLLPAEVVHHINENPEDNRPENLMLFESTHAHLRYHIDVLGTPVGRHTGEKARKLLGPAPAGKD